MTDAFALHMYEEFSIHEGPRRNWLMAIRSDRLQERLRLFLRSSYGHEAVGRFDNPTRLPMGHEIADLAIIKPILIEVLGDDFDETGAGRHLPMTDEEIAIVEGSCMGVTL